MDSEQQTSPVTKPGHNLQVVRLIAGVLMGVGISMVFAEWFWLLSVHAHFLYGSGEDPWWFFLAAFHLNVLVILAIFLIPPVITFLWLRPRGGSLLLSDGALLAIIALSITMAFFNFRHGVFHGIGIYGAMVAGMHYDVARRENPERVVAWAKEIIAKAPADADHDEVADSDVPEFVKHLWDGTPKRTVRTFPRVYVIKKTNEGNGSVVVHWRGFLRWGFQITPGNKSLILNQERVRGHEEVYWTPEIRIFAGA